VKIKARQHDDIVLSVVAPDRPFFSENVNVDVRAMDATLEKTVRLGPQTTGRGGTP